MNGPVPPVISYSPPTPLSPLAPAMLLCPGAGSAGEAPELPRGGVGNGRLETMPFGAISGSSREPASLWLAACPSSNLVRQPSVPTLWALARHAAKWLVLPALLLAAALLGLFFLEGERPSLWAMLLHGGAHGLTLCYFGLAFCVDSRSLLVRFTDTVQLLMVCSAEQALARLSEEPRLRCLQHAAYSAWARVAPTPDDGFEAQGTSLYDQLHFLQADITAHQASQDGHVILDAIGTILWCNEAFSCYFKYQHGALFSENIRILIPPPYNALHDSLMLQYDRTSSTKKVVGCCRPVPVVDREGRHSKVRLTVEERRDPMDEANVVFLGKMVWPKEPELHVVVQRWVAAGSTMLEACKAADSPWDDFLLVDAHDTILYANAGVCAMLGWHREELQGQPLAVLMDPEVGKSHGGLVQSYIHRSGGDQLRGECTSTAVGKSRDLYARCRRGHYIRTWLSVHRIDATSRKSTDCCFIGTMVHIQGHAARSSGPLTPHRPPDLLPIAAHGDRRDSYSIPAPSHRAARRASSIFSTETTTTLFHYTSTGKQRHAALSGVCWKRCTVVAFDFHSTPQLGEAVGSEYEAFISLLVAACSRHTAVMHTPLGNRVLVSLNFAAPNLSQRSAAGLLMDQVLQGYSAIKEDASELRAAAACGEAMCAMYHRQPVILGDLIDNCDCMLAVAAEARVERGLIDPTLFEELQYAYNCRLINVATLSRANSPAKRMLVYELHAVKQVDENEWMYQIEAQHRKDPLASWRGCWDHLLAPVARGLPPDYAAALTCLDQHIAECSNDAPPDAPTLWLRTTLRQRLSPPPSPVPHPAVLLCSRGRCVIHYSVAPDHTGEVEQFHATDPNATSGSEPLSPKG